MTSKINQVDKQLPVDNNKVDVSNLEPFYDVLNSLKSLVKNNADYFRNDDTEMGQRIFEASRSLDLQIDTLVPKIEYVAHLAPNYDYDSSVPGNGYRSFLLVIKNAVQHCIEISRQIQLKRDKMIFRKSIYVKEIESCNHLIISLLQCLNHLITLSKWSEPGVLFPQDNCTPQDLLNTGDSINQYCFYGRCLGFQFCEGMRGILKFIILSMTSFSEVYFNQGNLFSKATCSMWVSGKYLLDPELRARRVVNISQHADINFCKAFWCLAESEVMQLVPRLAPTSQIFVNRLISIPPEPLQYICKNSQRIIDIPVPTSHKPKAPIQIRLISSVARAGMLGEGNNSQSIFVSPKSSTLLFHCHGGGFVSQSSLAHMVYLREWAVQLNTPIVSVDYSLAPEAPYPRALEEILYAYVWTLNNCHLLGTTGERIIFAGDSAGANLVTALSLKCIDYGLPPAYGIFLAYVPVAVNFWPTPARMLCLMDPLLPIGFMLRCIKAYAVPNSSTIKQTRSNSIEDSFEEVTESDFAELQAHKSLVENSCEDNVSDTLTNVSLSSQNVSPPPMQSSQLRPDENISSAADDWCKLTDEDLGEALNNVSEFNTLLSEIDTHLVDVDENSTSSKSQSYGLKRKINSLLTTITTTFNKLTTGSPKSKSVFDFDDLELPNIDLIRDEFNVDVSKDPFMSPYYADDDVLRQLPPVRILTVELDPCLDDCVTFAKKLKNLGNDINLEILQGLPHGFLNFSLFSKEAQEGSKRCTEIIKTLFKLESHSPAEDTTPDQMEELSQTKT